jgi:hypothetical protein
VFFKVVDQYVSSLSESLISLVFVRLVIAQFGTLYLIRIINMQSDIKYELPKIEDASLETKKENFLIDIGVLLVFFKLLIFKL